MIQTFADETTEQIFQGIHGHAIHKNFTGPMLKVIERRLDLLNCVDSLEELHKIPSMQGEAAQRDAHGKHSIPITREWRIAFHWTDKGPQDVEIKT